MRIGSEVEKSRRRSIKIPVLLIVFIYRCVAVAGLYIEKHYSYSLTRSFLVEFFMQTKAIAASLISKVELGEKGYRFHTSAFQNICSHIANDLFFLPRYIFISLEIFA